MILALLLAVTPPAPVEIQMGPVKLAVHASRTAQVFYTVDQVSQWSQYNHRMYRRWAEAEGLDAADRALLQKHVEVRSRRGWGKGLEAAFDVDLPLEQAAAEAVKKGVLTDVDAKVELEVLQHFAPRVDRLIARRQPRFTQTVDELRAHANELGALLAKVMAVAEVKQVPTQHAFLMADPGESEGMAGGGANGGVLAIEVGARSLAAPTLLHETIHHVLDLSPKPPGVLAWESHADSQTVSEAIVYALMPGIYPANPGHDALAEQLEADLVAHKPTEHPYVQFRGLALVLRPAIADALEHGTPLREVLPPLLHRFGPRDPTFVATDGGAADGGASDAGR